MLSLNDALHNYKKKKEEKKRVNNLLKYSPAFEIELDSFAMSAGKCGYLLFHPKAKNGSNGDNVDKDSNEIRSSK